jgi:hypothetical protein
MLIYNVTFKLNPSIHKDWVQWMKEKHIPDVMAKGCFTEYRFARLLDLDDSDGPTYTIQYCAENREQYDRYIELFAPMLRKDVTKKWGENAIGFRSLMELVN